MPNRGWKLDDPVLASVPKFNKGRAQDLLNLVYAGKLYYKEELTLQLLAICKIILVKSMYKNPTLQRNMQDLIGILMLQTCIWVDELSKHELDIDPTPEYYWQMIKNDIIDFNDGDSNPNVTGNWLRKQHGRGKSPPTRIRLKDDLLFINPTVVMDLEDILITLAETDREKEFIVLRFQGYTDTEIAEEFDVHEATVYRTRLLLEKRYDDYLYVTRGLEE